MINTYRPNPDARVEAMLFEPSAIEEALDWANDNLRTIAAGGGAKWQVKTLEGWVDMPLYSLLVKGTHGEFYPVSPDVFEKRWVKV